MMTPPHLTPTELGWWVEVRRQTRSTRAKIAFIATMVAAVLLSASLVLFKAASDHAAREQLRKDGLTALNEIQTSIRQGTMPRPLRVSVPEFYLLQIVDSSNRVVSASEALRGSSSIARGRPIHTRPTAVLTRQGEGLFYSATVRMTETRWGQIDIYAVAPIARNPPQGRILMQTLGVAVPTLMGLIGMIIWWAVGRALRPVGVIADELASIGGRDLDQRVTVPGSGDELQRLAVAVNASLSRLEDFVTRQQHFLSDASHEIRSPITGLQARLEDAIAEPPEDWSDLARAALADTERLARTSNELLTLAKLDAFGTAAHVPVLLEALVEEEAKRPRRVKVSVIATGSPMVNGDAHQLRRLITNLLDNAARHAHSAVTVTLADNGPFAVMEVIDDGDGIPPEDRERVFQRFIRRPDSRALDTNGTGLGLPIVRGIAQAHSGTVHAEDPPPGTTGARFVVRIPRRRLRGTP